MAICRDIEGWDTVSRLRDFDTTPGFEEGVCLHILQPAFAKVPQEYSVFVHRARSTIIKNFKLKKR
jgi:hypothetical protein